jgi:hypothetical protein
MTDYANGWKPRYLVQKAPGIDGNPIPDFEPVVVVRGQDALALEVMDFYTQRYAETYGDEADAEVLSDLAAHRDQLEWFRQTYPERIKRADR